MVKHTAQIFKLNQPKTICPNKLTISYDRGIILLLAICRSLAQEILALSGKVLEGCFEVTLH